MGQNRNVANSARLAAHISEPLRNGQQNRNVINLVRLAAHIREPLRNKSIALLLRDYGYGQIQCGLLEGYAPPKQSKLCGRLPLTPEATPWGMEGAPAGSADYWDQSVEAQVDLFASECTTHHPLWFSLAETSALLCSAGSKRSCRLLYAFP